MFAKIAVELFEAGDFLNVFLRFWGFEAHFLIKIFLIKKMCNPVLPMDLNKSSR